MQLNQRETKLEARGIKKMQVAARSRAPLLRRNALHATTDLASRRSDNETNAKLSSCGRGRVDDANSKLSPRNSRAIERTAH